MSDFKIAKDQTMKNDTDYSKIMGFGFVLVGIVIAAARFMDVAFDNWWALFMFIPAAFFLTNVMGDYRQHGTLTAKSSSFLVAGVATGLMACIFLFNLSMSLIFPASLVIAGVAVLASRN